MPGRDQGGHDDTAVGWFEERRTAGRDWKMRRKIVVAPVV